MGDDNCQVKSNENWGWCIPGCDGSLTEHEEKVFRLKVHELPVDAFVYENCSLNVDTFHEFCTGNPITQGRVEEFRQSRGVFKRVRVTEKEFHPGDIGWNGNRTIIRSFLIHL